ncbi:MAG: tRNA 2-thiouridine(34) synthase MnmA [Bacteroidetes bacterium]|nr:MAG: tRNA 2-thiouridine(34) synthase MnmA [Bacteroidota bacterium]
MAERVVIGLSGGVDSSVAAYLLKEAGYDVLGIYMRNWNDSTGLLKGDCPFEEDSRFAELVARRLGIDFELVDLSSEYRSQVVDYLFREYERGRTPNPDVLCNREIKFAAFWDVAVSRGADYVATGHYCRRGVYEVDGEVRYSLLAGVDGGKDQSYFLCQVTQEQLAHAMFPVGELQKSEVREIAKKLRLATADRKDSYGICFVGEVDIPTFLSQRLKGEAGDIIEIPREFRPRIAGDDLLSQSSMYDIKPDDGLVVGCHGGAHFYTIGQRKGLGVGGKALPLFVLATDVERNIVYVGQGHDHPLLNRRVVRVECSTEREGEHWLDPAERLGEQEERAFKVRLRYRQPLQEARLVREDGNLFIVFDSLQRGATPGQFAVWYDGARLVGSGALAG